MNNEKELITGVEPAYIFRPMTQEDLDRVMAIEMQCFTDPWNRGGFESSLTEKAAHLMVLAPGDRPECVMGYCCLYETLGDGDIVNVAIDPSMRKMGLGHQMIHELIVYGRTLKVERYFLEVRESNTAGIKLYEGLGFKAYGIRKNFYTMPLENAVLMMLEDNAQ